MICLINNLIIKLVNQFNDLYPHEETRFEMYSFASFDKRLLFHAGKTINRITSGLHFNM